MIQCLECKGNGQILIYGHKDLHFTCFRCNGNGLVQEESIEWRKNGIILSEIRRDYQLTLRDAAKFLKMKVKTLSNMEIGIIKPDMSINYSKIRIIKR